MFRDAALIAGKDLRIEWRSRSRSIRSCRSPSWCSCSSVRARPRPGHAARGHARLVLDRRALHGGARGAAVVQHRGGRRRSRRPAPVGPRSRRHLPGQGGRPRAALLALEATLGVGVAILYGTASDPKAETAGVFAVSGRRFDRARSPRSAWPLPARCTEPSPPDCEFVTRCCPCCSSPPSHRS